jgi:serine/threonine protein kinase
VRAPGRHLLTCEACKRTFPVTVPETSAPASDMGEHAAAAAPMGAEEKPLGDGAPEATLVVPFVPVPFTAKEEPREGAGRVRTGERKVPLPAEPREEVGRVRTGERRVPLPAEPREEAGRVRTGERRVPLPAEPREEAGRVRTGERRVPLPAEPREEAGRRRTSERKALPPSEPVEGRAPPLPQVPLGQVPLGDDMSPSDATLPSILQQVPLVSLPRPFIALTPAAPRKEEAPPGAPVDRTVVIRRPAVSPEAPPGPEERAALTAPDSPGALSTLPGAPPKDKPKGGPAEPQAPGRAPEAPKAPAPRRRMVMPPQESQPTEPATLPGAEGSGSLAGPDPSRTRARTADEEAESQSQPDRSAVTPGMRLGGYQLIQKIGAGGMGTVWLARQLSLDRDVAVKILRPGLAGDPQFVLRFTREAFAAAQLVHHNIVQIYDCGSDKKIHFFSMEYVDSESLLDLVNRNGPLDAEVAAGYVLQAARGLKYAHERGMVHRDIKPDNLLLNHNGVVKVADLGLVKRKWSAKTRQSPGGGMEEPITKVGSNPLESAVGTPAYMAPEQVENSSRVDARADTYSLGCTLYHLLTGRPPFEAETLNMVMTMHVKEEPVAPDELAPHVPKALSSIVLRMLAKRPQDRYQSMGEVIQALEEFLHIEGSVSFSPTEEHANLLERCVQEFNEAAWAKRRRWGVLGFCVLTLLATIVLDRRFGALAGAGVAAFFASTWMASFIMRGLLEKGALFLRFRQFVFQAPLGTWLVWLLMLGGAGYGLYSAGLLAATAGVLGLGLVCALAFYLLVDHNVEEERQPAVREVERMLRSMRLSGLEEGALREFVCRYSGEDWEAFFEALFGYDAKLSARERWGLNEREVPRPQYAAWRDPLIRGMDAWQRFRKRRREQRQLKILERKKAASLAQRGAPAGLE